jgi:hypothetical protein
MSIDLSNSYQSASSRLSAFKTYIEVSKAEKKARRDLANSTSKSVVNTATQLDKIETQQKRYLRNPPNSFDQLLNLISLVKGSGTDTTDFLRKRLLETSVKIEPEVKKIISDQAIKALGCSQEQTFNGYSQKDLLNLGINNLPEGQGIYIPVQSLDIINLLKEMPNDATGKVRYEKPTPSVTQNLFKPYGGLKPFPMNKEMNFRLDTNNSYLQTYGKYYQGESQKPLFDFAYSKTNEFGETQDCYRIALLNKDSGNPDQAIASGTTNNKVGELLQDYYGTIKIFDSVDFANAIIQIILGAIKLPVGSDELNDNTKAYKIIQRILGMCFDSRREIDVSGVAKVAELDGVDDTFFELTEVDLRQIDIKIDNIQNGVVEFEDCGNVKLPIDFNTILGELTNFRDVVDDQNIEEQVKSLESILNSISENPEFKVYVPNLNLKNIINQDIIKQIPLALAATIISPKVLLPIFTLLKVVQGGAITNANQLINSGNTIATPVNNIVNNQTDFLITFRKFNIEVISKIGALYIKTLFEILKKDILLLVRIIASDIAQSEIAKRNLIIQSSLQAIPAVLTSIKTRDDYRKCKSVIDDVESLIENIKNISELKLPTLVIPPPILQLRAFLPGTSTERETINTIQYMQQLGLPTEPLPDGSPNKMIQFISSAFKGKAKENAESGKTVVTRDLTNPSQSVGLSF